MFIRRAFYFALIRLGRTLYDNMNIVIAFKITTHVILDAATWFQRSESAALTVTLPRSI